MTTVNEQYDMAQFYHNKLGLHPLAIPWGSKQADVQWKYLRPHTVETIKRDFGQELKNIALIGGELSNNVFYIDFDNLKKLKTAFLEIPYLEGLASNTIAVKTGRGVHYYFKTERPVKTTRFDAGDIKGQSSYVIAPKSLHPNNKDYYTFLNQNIKIQEIEITDKKLKDFVKYFNLRFIDNYYTDNSKPYGISWNIWSQLKQGVPKGQRSNSEQSILVHLVSNDWHFDECLELFLQHSNKDSKFNDLNKQNRGQKYLSRSYQNAKDYISKNVSKTQKMINDFEAIAKGRGWIGRTRYSDEAIFNALIQIARRSNKTVFQASIRELSTLSHLSKKTVINAINRQKYFRKQIIENRCVFEMSKVTPY